MFIISHPMFLQFHASILPSWVTCIPRIAIAPLVVISSPALVIGIVAILLWRRLVPIASAGRSIAAFLAALVGMSVWVISFFMALLFTLALFAGDVVEVIPSLAVAVVVALAGYGLVECPPMRRNAWRDWREQPETGRLGLMLSLAFLGISLVPVVLFVWLVIYVASENCRAMG